MAASIVTVNDLHSAVQHESWCRPTGGRDDARMEEYPGYQDSGSNGRSEAVVRVIRCMECGRQSHHPLSSSTPTR